MNGKKLILDTNLLILFITGLSSRSYIKKHKRLSSYTEGDFDLLIDCINLSSKIIILPNVASETSNLIRHISDPIRSSILNTFSKLLEGFFEIYIPSHQAAAREEYLWLGLTDTALLCAIGSETVLLTADHHLHIAAKNSNLASVNFNHLRESNFPT